jgi:cell division protein FtsZ
VIINVTGGPDLSLLEVSEASAIVQEAAHEDANIIFGAVVDPQLNGKIKITVIATGFDKVPTVRGVPAAALQTPVDLSNYTTHLNAAPEAPAAADTFEAPRSEAMFATSVTLGRRPPIELSRPLAAAAASAGSGGDHSLDLDSPFDIPAFLRRQS